MQLLTMSSILLWIVVMLNLLLTLAVVRQTNNLLKTQLGAEGVKIETLKPGEAVPFFTATTLEGNEISLSNFSGQYIILIFVSSGCAPCREKIPEIEQLSPKALALGVRFVFVFNDDKDAAMGFVKEFNLTSQVIFAPIHSNTLFKDYKVPGTPYYYFIDYQAVVQDAGYFDSRWNSLVLRWTT